MSSGAKATRRLFQHVVCTQCGCLCDDIDVEVEGNAVVRVGRACPMGEGWFLGQDRPPRPAAWIGGRPAEPGAAIERAAEALARANYPLIYGLSECSSEAQRWAVSLADRLGAVIDGASSLLNSANILAMQRMGEVTCSLGEVKNRADLVLFWGTNPAVSQPRHFERYSVEPKGQFLPLGRADRTIVLVDNRRSETAAAVDLFFQIRPGKDFEVLWVLRAILKGQDVDERVEEEVGITRVQLTDLARRMKSARFGVLFFGKGLTMTRGRHRNLEAVLSLVRELNAHTCFAAAPMRSHGNITGAENVLTWQTGFPFGVDLSRGVPRYNPGETTAAEVLARREADAALFLGGNPLFELPAESLERLRAIPSIYVGPGRPASAEAATIAIETSVYGIHTAGTVYRQDDVPLPLRPPLVSPLPSIEKVLEAIERSVGTRPPSPITTRA